MRPNKLHAPRILGRRGFTLVELLVAVTIMAILAGMVSGALIVTRQSARTGATKATITKLHNIITAKYESYHTRRVPIDLASPYYGTNPGAAAAAKMLAVRDLMRMEMPERVTDIFVVDANGNPTAVRLPNPALTAPISLPPNPPPYSYGLDFRTSVIMNAYAARAVGPWSDPNPTVGQEKRRLASAECLYMIVTMLCGPEARRQFHASEIGDTNGNGLPEFLDGWGNPIRFLRWAPGFNDSDLQPNLVTDDELNATSAGSEHTAWTSATAIARRQDAATSDHDRLDPRQVNMAQPSDSPYVPNGSRLVPLIYSTGPRYRVPEPGFPDPVGISNGYADGTYAWNEVLIPDLNRIRYYGTEYDVPVPGKGTAWGLPVRIAGEWVHFDYIHNHRIEAE